MKKKLLVCALLTLSFSLVAQQGDGGIPKSTKASYSLKQIDKKSFSEPDIAALRVEDEITDKAGNAPWRFGFNNYTSLNMSNSGTWNTLPNGDRIWQLVITCENALTVNLTLDQVVLPEGNELYVYNPDKSFILGKFTAYHLYEGNLGTELIPGNTAIIEYYIPAKNMGEIASLNVNTVTHGYRTAGEFAEKAFNSSGSCNMNVNCTDGTPWANQRNGALMLVSGSNGFCSGSLINNTQNDGKPYVLTANHCYSSPASWIFRFNWQAAGCTTPGSSPIFSSLSGAVLRARRTPSDFCLVEITGGLVNNTVPASYNPYFSGWDNTGAIPSSAVCIHHPAGDIKKISFDDNPLVISQAMGSTEANSTWTLHWDRNTTTEGGSSGSPLFDQNHRIVGQLWGGGASCSSLNSADYYGRLANSWNPAGSDSTNHLKSWLDPNNNGATIVDGYDPAGPAVALDATMSNPLGVSGIICTGTILPIITIVNFGTSTLTSATINYGFDGTTGLVYNWTGSLSQYASSVITLPTATLNSGNHSFKAIISNPNALTDQNQSNDTVTSSFNVVVNGDVVNLNLTLDCYGDEISWVLQDNTGTTTLFSGGTYTQTPATTTINVPFCLNDGCYKFTINDSYGDGLQGGSCTNGSYTITTQDGTTLAELSSANANFGYTHSDSFCISTTGLKEYTASWKLYPNPVSDYLTIETPASGLKIIIITNATGQMVQTFQSELNTITLPANALAKGMYFIQLTSNEGTSQKNFIVK
ncbi:T9SS type A sorting domain-containing protein [Fluviicola sp.]|jgi:V8-like Glu-specific endopeptidase|uniref:T9SS type A sorting domain-containing protein n=1 Tax=Fluviicola sp. TaxID=1917219 RepID=UPI0028186BD4|nr:T9SS type A sorting domain-containing protein [Fluviicola sp.]MDR0801538.1 T9SS type A sorting domain-containing protein [Fluviicola sp.]